MVVIDFISRVNGFESGKRHAERHGVFLRSYLVLRIIWGSFKKSALTNVSFLADTGERKNYAHHPIPICC